MQQMDEVLPEIDSSVIEAYFRNMEQEETTLSAMWGTTSDRYSHAGHHAAAVAAAAHALHSQLTGDLAAAVESHQPNLYDEAFYRLHAGSNSSISSSGAGSIASGSSGTVDALQRFHEQQLPPFSQSSVIPPLPVFTYSYMPR